MLPTRKKRVPPPPIRSRLLVLAREACGITQSQLALRVEMTQAHVSRFEAGISIPTPDTLKRIAAELGRPVEFFELTDDLYGIDTSLLLHRKKKALSAKLLRQLHAEVNVRRLQISRLLLAAHIEPTVPFPFIDVHEQRGGPTAIAQNARAAWCLPRGPIENLTAAIESAGGLILSWPCGSRHFDGVSQIASGAPPLFVLNSEAPSDRLRFSLAHEVGHVIMHRLPSETAESEANAFASEFLMPRADIISELHGLTLSRLAELKSYWRVSMQALLMRATQLKAISESAGRKLWIELSSAGYRSEEPIETQFPSETPTAVRQLVEYHRVELGYTLDELAHLMCATVEDVSRFYLNRSVLSVLK
jgi:Zn-dependent peptidase ImmA (M78 family)/transcriptional regulator with XRE-family HTH domain